MTVIHKTTVAQAAGDPLTFVLSDATKDRMGDVIEPKGWQLENFKQNPMALFNHNSSFPIGRWEDVKVQGERLVGKLKLAARGTSDRIDEIISLVEQGILRAVSVGFAPIERKALDDGGVRFLKQELLETSLVSIPANPAAVQLAKSLHVSDVTMGIVFGKHATADVIHKGEGILNAAQGKELSTFHRKTREMENDPKARVGLQIQEHQSRLVALQDQLASKVADIDSGDSVDEIESLNSQIGSTQKTLSVLKQTEASLAGQVQQAVVAIPQHTAGYQVPVRETSTAIPKTWASVGKKLEPFDHVVRAATIAMLSHIRHQNPIDVLKAEYGEDRTTKAVTDLMVTRAASAPALTTTTGWAAELVQTGYLDIIETLIADSVYPALRALGGQYTFGRNGVVSLPARSTATTVAGSFVGQGAPIPVRQGAFTATTLTPKKLAVITTFSREMAQHSTPQIEQVLRQAIVEDTSVAIDTILLDATAASAIRPAGLRNGVTGGTPTAGGGVNAVTTDVRALIGALITGTNGNMRRPVWVMNPAQALALSLITNTNGAFVFRDEIGNNRFQGYPVVQSSTVTAATVLLIDAADFFTATGDAPQFTASDQATLHMEDTTPLAIGTAGAPATVAAPVRSLFQTDSLAIRMTLDMNWSMRRTGTVAYTAVVTW
jgi:HK97 family phage major capsid protein/HK97 family phage prohead protease